MIENPDIHGALALWRACDGKPGIEALKRLTPHAVQAFGVIAAGHAAKLKSDMDKATKAPPTTEAPTRRRR